MERCVQSSAWSVAIGGNPGGGQLTPPAATGREVLSRTNHYGSQSELRTWVTTLLYSVVETCKLLDVDLVADVNEALRRR